MTAAAVMVAILAVSMFAMAPSAQAEDSEGPTRAQYIAQLEPICAADTRRNANILKGTRQMIARGHLRAAAPRFTRAARAFTGTLRQVLRVPRPAADRTILNGWFRHLIRQRSYLLQISRALTGGNGFQAQRLSVVLIRNANQANSAVLGYGFRSCQIQPSRFL